MKSNLLSRIVFERLSHIVFSVALLCITTATIAQTVTTNTQSTHNGFFYSFWNDGTQGSASMTLGAAGNYTTTWNNVGNFTAGKGWSVGKADRVVCFSGSFNGGSNGFLALYGWTKNNLIEYYVCENHGQWTPPGNTSDIQQKGTYTSDGGTYTIYTATRTNQPSIIGNATFKQYWSVRTQTRSSGTITFANHVAAWQAAGMPMGTTWDYQIMESEGYHSSGSSNITVSECVSCATPAPTTTASFDYEIGATATQLTATGTAIKWYTVASGGTALGSAPTPSTATAGTIKYYVGQTLNGCEGPRVEVTIRVSQKYKIFKVPTAITIDGTIESAWTNASVLPASAAKLLSGTVSNSADLSGNFKALWDDTYLYVLADVTDANLVNESTNVYDDDAVEVYVDINNNKTTTYGTNDVQYSFGWNDGTTVGVLPTGRSTTNVTYKAVAKTGGYIVEARIPWTTLQGTPAIGQLVGMDFMINDDDDNTTRDGKLSWNADTDNAWENPSLFGTAVLQGLLPCTTPAAPIVVTTPILYCLNAPATPLTATGTSLLWYTSPTNGTGVATLTPSTTAIGNVSYYVTQNVGGCESARALVSIVVEGGPAVPTVVTPVTYCQGATAVPLTASGSGLKWYANNTITTALPTAPTPSTATVGTTTYYVSQTFNICESARVPINVIVVQAPSAPTVISPVVYCQGAVASQLTPNGGTFKWYADNTTTTALPTAPTPSTATVGTITYYVSQTVNTCESARAQITVTVTAAPAAPTVVTPVTYCQGAVAVPLTASGSGLKWYADNTTTTALPTAPTPSTATSGTTTYYVSQTFNICESARAQITVMVIQSSPAPTVVTPVTYCQGAVAVPLTASGSGLKWYADNTTTTALPSAPTPSTTTAGTTTYYVSQAPNMCESTRAQITVVVVLKPLVPIVVSPVTYCQGVTAVPLTAYGSGLKWYADNTTPTPIASPSTPITSAVGTTNYFVSQTANGCESSRAQITVVVNALPAAVITPAGSTTIPAGGSVTLNANTGSGLLYKWFNESTQVGTGASYVANTDGSYEVEVTNGSGCKATSAPVTITIESTTTGITTGNNTYANVYPIPARDEIVVETDLDLTNASVKITNALGEEVSLIVSIQGSDAKLNVSGLVDGAYILVIRQDSNIVTKKIIIAH